VRGYDSSSRFGRYAWTATAEYRFPLLLVNRGFRAWPLHVDRIIGAVFADAGNAWGPDVSFTGFPNPLRVALASVGAEVTTEVLGRYDTQLRLRLGAAVPLVEGDGARVYLRVGLPF
jgi:hemolysin activation/secretion protein